MFAVVLLLVRRSVNQIFGVEKKMIDAITTLKEKVVLLSPDKGNGVVLLDKADYTESLDQLFADRSKFQILAEDPTNTRLKSI